MRIPARLQKSILSHSAWAFFFLWTFFLPSSALCEQTIGPDRHQLQFSQIFQDLARVSDKDTGSKGFVQTAAYIESHFKTLGYDRVDSQTFSMPARLKTRSCITIVGTGQTADIDPFLSNAVSPHTLSSPGITGPLVYVGKGEFSEFNRKKIKNAIVLMDLDSGGNWVNALSFGAKAILYVVQDLPNRFLFQDKIELSPVTFPRFILAEKQARDMFPNFRDKGSANPETRVTLVSDLQWTRVTAKNIYCLIPGYDPAAADDLLIIESFYDTQGFIPGKSPGADQSCSIASLLDLAAFLKDNPPRRSILLVATSGHGNGLAGMRELIWGITAKNKDLKKIQSQNKKILAEAEQSLDVLKKFDIYRAMEMDRLTQVHNSIQDIIKTKIDIQSNLLMQLRLEKTPDNAKIKQLVSQRMSLKRLENKNDLALLSTAETVLIAGLIPEAIDRLKKIIADSIAHENDFASTMRLVNLVGTRKIQMIVSLHLSSHGNGIGAFNEGGLYAIKESINTFAPYVKLNNILINSGEKTARLLDTKNIFKDTLRPSLHRPWQSYLSDLPALGGEVSRLAGYLGLSLVTTNDARQYWNTPNDTLKTVNMDKAAAQSRFVCGLIATLASADDVSPARRPRNEFATLKGRANFLRHGAVFADAPAPDSLVVSFQGPGIFYTMADESGNFWVKGVATRKQTLHKVILEAYKFDRQNGNAVWAVDKRKTTKDRYRVKITKSYMETDLVMFPCSQTTILNLLEPRTFQYMTKIQVLDARTNAAPIRHWYSRIDTRSSIINSIFLPPGTRMKLTLSDTLLSKKFILAHSDRLHPDGNGYRIDETPIIAPSGYLAARDMWALLNPRINNLEEKGINSQKIRDLQLQGNAALEKAGTFLSTYTYDKFMDASGTALALAGRVYAHVETTQKDVLYGVLFYIVLFAPFAFCLERFLFSFINIYKRIAGFVCILVTLIAIIYNVHPAFDLAYSPIVIILAFFIIGLSAMVTWIIFHHFENEMKLLQQQGKRSSTGEISFLKAFSASFFMGINNLRRRRTRTVLTCTTLIILTFTIMSFTSVKNIRQHSKLLYNTTAPYQGLLLKQINWTSLPKEAFNIIENTMADEMIAAPRVWLETANRTQSTQIPIGSADVTFEAKGLIGLSPMESDISRLADHLTRGRWFSQTDRYAIILPERMALYLNLPDLDKEESVIRLWSIPFKVIGTFSGRTFDQFRDLDGEPITPAIFPDEIFQKTTDAEMDALESGDDIKAFQSRYKHLPFDQTVIIPHNTLLSLGGNLKSVALAYHNAPENHSTTFQMVDRFGLWLFSGEKKGVFLYNASDSFNYSGLPNILIPILISIFIVLNTMINSVQERKREIGIYTSIGMAPSHVSIIFIAEALSYAVISVVLGYIMAQVIVKVFAGTALLNGITVNYSSLSGVFAMAMVILVVLLSSIYPSKIAAAIAIPDVEKSWALARAKGDTLDIELPFLIKHSEEFSICGYLYDLFNTHRAVSHGSFSVGRLTILSPKNNEEPRGKADYQIVFTAWLAPFDLGIMQHVRFTVKFSSHFKNYMEIGMSIIRKSGEHNTWWRVNKRFVNLIRKKLLIWRSMDTAEKQGYHTLMESHVKEKDIPIA